MGRRGCGLKGQGGCGRGSRGCGSRGLWVEGQGLWVEGVMKVTEFMPERGTNTRSSPFHPSSQL